MRKVEFIDRQTGEVTETQLRAASAFGAIKLIPRGDEYELRMGFSVPKLLSGSNLQCASIEDTRRAVQIAYDSLGESCQWTQELSDLRLRRIDVVRDFTDVSRPGEILGEIARRGLNKRIVYYTAGNVETIYLGSQSHEYRQMYLYDKFVETQASQPDKAGDAVGRVRFEVRLYASLLKTKSISFVRDLCEGAQSLEDLRRRAWEFSRAGQSAWSPGWFDISRLFHLDQLTPTKKARLLLLTFADQLGVPSGYNSVTVRAGRKDWHLIKPFMSDPGIVLDYDLGRAVPVAGQSQAHG